MANVEARLRTIVVDELACEAAEVTKTARFDNDLGADSFDMVEIVMRVEEEFGIEVPDDCPELGPGKTFGDAVKYIEGRL